MQDFLSNSLEYIARLQQILLEWTEVFSCKFVLENDLAKQRKNPTENSVVLGVFSVKQR